jgi:hypothetical protein
VAAAQREVVHAQHRRHHSRWIGQCPHQAQQRAAASRQSQPAGQPRPGSARQRQADRLQHPACQRAAASIRRGQAGDLFGEGAGWAGGVVAEEAADPQSDQHVLAADGRVGQGALVAAVHLG